MQYATPASSTIVTGTLISSRARAIERPVPSGCKSCDDHLQNMSNPRPSQQHASISCMSTYATAQLNHARQYGNNRCNQSCPSDRCQAASSMGTPPTRPSVTTTSNWMPCLTARRSSASTTRLCPCVNTRVPLRMKRAPSSAMVCRARVDVSAKWLPRCAQQSDRQQNIPHTRDLNYADNSIMQTDLQAVGKPVCVM